MVVDVNSKLIEKFMELADQRKESEFVVTLGMGDVLEIRSALLLQEAQTQVLDVLIGVTDDLSDKYKGD